MPGNNCRRCNRCQSCQAFCETGSQLVDSYYDVSLPTINKDDIIIKKVNPSVLNTIAQNIINAGNKGSEKDSNPGSWQNIMKQFMYAEDINRLLELMVSGELNASPPPHVSKDQVIYAEYFRRLKAALESMTIASDACDKCNTSCDSCVSCQHTSCHSSCHSSCY